MKGTWNLGLVFHIVQKIPENYCPCLYLSISPVSWLNELLFRHIQKRTLSHELILNHDVTDLVNHEMVKNTKTCISWEHNITFLQNKKILNLCLRWNIFRSYCFVAEVTFNLLKIPWIHRCLVRIFFEKHHWIRSF